MIPGVSALTIVAVVQAFQRIPAPHTLATTRSELPFVVAQVVTLAVFLWLGFVAIRKFHASPAKLA